MDAAHRRYRCAAFLLPGIRPMCYILYNNVGEAIFQKKKFENVKTEMKTEIIVCYSEGNTEERR